MRDNYVGSPQDLILANQNQKSKIEYLQRQRIKRDHYLNDLKQNLKINKQTLIDMNRQGNNDPAVTQLLLQNKKLQAQLQHQYEDYQNLNAMMLMQQQMRLQDRQYYNQRLVQFQNKISDFRKYLHDKQDTYNSVSLRLKRYQEMNEPCLQEKLFAYKPEISQKSQNEFIAQLLNQKNYYQKEYENILQDFLVFNQLKFTLVAKFPQMEGIVNAFEQEKGTKLSALASDTYRKLEGDQRRRQEQKDKRKLRMDPNKELIRLLKKEKLNNELLQEALRKAIQQNQQLSISNQTLKNSLVNLQSKFGLLTAQNHILAIRIGHYDSHYSRKVSHNRKYYQQGEIQGLQYITCNKLKEYSKQIKNYYQKQSDLYREFSNKLKADVQKWATYMAQSDKIKRKHIQQRLLCKSCSMPQLLVNFQLQNQQDDEQLVIEEI